MAHSHTAISQDQQDKLFQFIAMTNAEVDIAYKFLIGTSWNMETAIDRFFAFGGDASKLAAAGHGNNDNNNNVNQYPPVVEQDTIKSSFINALAAHELSAEQYEETFLDHGIKEMNDINNMNQKQLMEIAKEADMSTDDTEKWLKACKEHQWTRFERIDNALAEYYKSMQRTDYNNKFLKYCKMNDFNPHEIDMEILGQTVSWDNCIYLGWEKDPNEFPFYKKLPVQDMKKKMYEMIKYCHKMGMAPSGSDLIRMQWIIGSKVKIVQNNETYVGVIRNIFYDEYNRNQEYLTVMYGSAQWINIVRWNDHQKFANMHELLPIIPIESEEDSMSMYKKQSLDVVLLQTIIAHYGRTYGLIIPMAVIELMSLWYDENTICLLVTIFNSKGRRTVTVPVNPDTVFLNIKNSIAGMENMENEIDDYTLEIPQLHKELKGHLSSKDYNFHTNQMLVLRRINQYKK